MSLRATSSASCNCCVKVTITVRRKRQDNYYLKYERAKHTVDAGFNLYSGADFQNYLRTQTGSTTTINIIICTVDYLLRLQVGWGAYFETSLFFLFSMFSTDFLQ